MGYKKNPAWLSTMNLHNTYLSTDQAPFSSSSLSDPTSSRVIDPRRPRIHIQAIQSSVVYTHILGMVPRIHGLEPSAPEASEYLDQEGTLPDSTTNIGPQGNGSPYPQGYPIQIPRKGTFDLVVHVGVGSKGAIAVEKVAHKRGYQIPDVKKELAPLATDQSKTIRRENQPSQAEERERARYQSDNGTASFPSKPADPIRGFGRGYEEFQDEEINSNDLTSLIKWLEEECHLQNVRESHDAGRYLCDYIVRT